MKKGYQSVNQNSESILCHSLIITVISTHKLKTENFKAVQDSLAIGLVLWIVFELPEKKGACDPFLLYL